MQSLTKPKSQPFVRNRLLRDASLQAVYDAMAADPCVHLFGEGCEVKVHYDAPKIEADFPDRVHTMPICEDGSINFCVGASLLGVKPIIDVISSDFLYRAMDSICNTAAKVNFMRPGEPPKTIVVRAEFLTGGPTTGQRPEVLFAHISGLQVVIPSTPYDAYGLMRTALSTPGVTIYFEDRMIADELPWDHHDLASGPSVRIGLACIRRYGQRGTATIVTYGVMRQRVEALLASWGKGDPYRQPNLDCGVIDLRSIYPIDWQAIRYALGRAGQLLIVEPDIQYGGVGAEIAAWAAEEMPRVRVKRLGAKRATIPAAPSLHHTALPTDEEIVAAITDLTSY